MTDAPHHRDQDLLDELVTELLDEVGPAIALTSDLPGLEIIQANRHDPRALEALLQAQRAHWAKAQATFELAVRVLDEAIGLLGTVNRGPS